MSPSRTADQDAVPDSPMDAQPPHFMLSARGPRAASQSRTSSSSTLVPMQHLYPEIPNGLIVQETTTIPATVELRFPRTVSEPLLHSRAPSRQASCPDLVLSAAAATPSSSSLSRPPSAPLDPSPSTTSAGPSPERSPSLQDRRKLQQLSGLPGLTCVVDSVAHALATPVDLQPLVLGSPTSSSATPSASRASFVAAGSERETTPDRARPVALDRTPRPSPTVPVDSEPATIEPPSAQPDHLPREASGPQDGLGMSSRSDSWDSAIPEGSSWSRLQLQFQDGRRHDVSSFSQSASVGSTHVTTPDSEDPHHYVSSRSSSLHHPHLHQHHTHGQHSAPHASSHLSSRAGALPSLPSAGTFHTDGLPVFSPSPFFKEIVSAHTAGDRSSHASLDAAGMPFTALAQSPPHRMDPAALYAHYQASAHKVPSRTEGFFDYGARSSAAAAAARPHQPPLHHPEPAHRTAAANGAKQRGAGADATLGSSAFAPGLRTRMEEIMERVSDKLDWRKAGGDGVITIVEYSATQGASKELVCPILVKFNSRQPPNAELSQFMVYHQSAHEDLRQHTASLSAEGSYLSPAFLDGQHPTLKDRVFAYSVIKAFAAAMAPPRTVHVGFSVLDLQWLHAPRPSTLSMSAAADKELRDFLSARSREFRPEGVLVLAFVMSNSKQPLRASSTSTASSPQSSSFRGAKARPDGNGSLPYPSNEPTHGSKQRAGSLSDTPLAAGSDVWRQISSVLAVCITRLVSIGSIRSAVAPLLTTGLPLWPRSSAELRSTLSAADVASDWEVVQSHGLTDEDDTTVPDDDGPFSMIHPAYRALMAGTLSTNSYAEHAVSFVKIIYEAHFRTVMLERAGMSRGATEMTLQALFSILTEKCEEGCLDGLALDFGILALRRL